jgi:hypothetical protein
MKDTKDEESTYPLINGEDDTPLRHDMNSNIAPQWATTLSDYNLWRFLFFALLSMNILSGVFSILYVHKDKQPSLTSQGLIPKSAKKRTVFEDIELTDP